MSVVTAEQRRTIEECAQTLDRLQTEYKEWTEAQVAVELAAERIRNLAKEDSNAADQG